MKSKCLQQKATKLFYLFIMICLLATNSGAVQTVQAAEVEETSPAKVLRSADISPISKPISQLSSNQKFVRLWYDTAEDLWVETPFYQWNITGGKNITALMKGNEKYEWNANSQAINLRIIDKLFFLSPANGSTTTRIFYTLPDEAVVYLERKVANKIEGIELSFRASDGLIRLTHRWQGPNSPIFPLSQQSPLISRIHPTKDQNGVFPPRHGRPGWSYSLRFDSVASQGQSFLWQSGTQIEQFPGTSCYTQYPSMEPAVHDPCQFPNFFLPGQVLGTEYLYLYTAETAAYQDPVDTIVSALQLTLPDLNVASIERTPRYNYDAPKNNPAPGDVVTFNARIANRGGQPTGAFQYAWYIDQVLIQSNTYFNLVAGEVATISLDWTWQDGPHTVRLVLDEPNVITEVSEQNNNVEDRTNGLAVGFWVEQRVYDYYNLHQVELGLGSVSWDDWAQRHIRVWNQMMADAVHPLTPQGIIDRVRLDQVKVVPDGSLPDPYPSNLPDISDKAVDMMWGFVAESVDPGAFYTWESNQNLDPGLLHELSHARYLIDLYGLDVGFGAKYLASGVTSTATVLTVSGDADWTTPAYLAVEGELIECQTASGNSFINCLRGAEGTTPRAHNASTLVNQALLRLQDGQGNLILNSLALPLVGPYNDHVYYNRYDNNDLMAGGMPPVYGQHSAYAWNLIAGQRPPCGNYNAPCNIGRYLNDLPEHNVVKIHDMNGQPIYGARVDLFQAKPNEGWYGKLYLNSPDATYYTDASGHADLGNFPFDTNPPIVHTYGHSDADLLLKISYGALSFYRFFEVTEANEAYWSGHQNVATYTFDVDISNPCPPITDWKGEYWNNENLNGDAVVCRNDPDVNFAWGGGSPDPSISANHFSARWMRTVYFDSGSYRFHIDHDDGARIYVDNVLVGDFWSTCCTWDAADKELQAGNHFIRVEMHEIDGAANIQLQWERVYNLSVNKSGSGTVTSDPPGIDCGSDCSESYAYDRLITLTATPADGSTFTGWTGGGCSGTGTCTVFMKADLSVTANFAASCPTVTDWKGEYWNNEDLSGDWVLCRNDLNVNFGWGDASPDPLISADHFSARWTRTFYFDTGLYRFHVDHDDGARIYIDNVLVPGGDFWNTCCVWDSVDKQLQAGSHIIRLEMHEIDGSANIQLWWERVYNLSINKSGTGSGTVTSDPTGIDCGTDCSEGYTPGTPVTLTATSAAGSTFTGWSGGGCAGTGTCTVTVMADTVITAKFDLTAPPTNSLYLSLTGGQTIGGVTAADEDILKFDGSTWSLFFDGSDVGVASPDLFAFSIVDDHTILMSFSAAVTVQSISVAPQDIVKFDATSLGSNTAGTFSMYFDGSDVGLSATAEKIDALALLPDGRLVISTTGNPAVSTLTGLADEDILAFTPATLGTNTSGTWALYFDGSDVGLSTTTGEDVDALDVSGGKIYLSTVGDFAVNGISGANEDVFVCTPTSLGSTTACDYSSTLYFDGSSVGLAANDVDAINLLSTGPATPVLTVNKTGSGTGTVTSSPSGINCGSSCSAAFPTSTVITLTATAASGSTFTGWSGGGCSGTGACTVTMTASTSVTADFTSQVSSTLTVSKTGTGTGTVTSSPAGINCGSTCSAGFLNNTVVTLTAAAGSGSTFTGWSGGGCSGTGTCIVTISANVSVTANFNLQTSNYTFTVNKTGTGTGTVTSNPPGINCGSTCSYAFASNTVVTLTATAASGSTFTGWNGGGCSGTGTCIVTMSSNTSVTANFNLDPTGTIFTDGFESGNFAAWSANTNDLGDLSVTSLAKLVGNWGMQAVIDDANAIFVRDDTPNAELRYWASFYFDPNSIPLTVGDAHFIFKGFSGTSSSYTELLRVEFGKTSAGYQLRASLLDDGTIWVNTPWFTISDAPHLIALDWRAATAVGANNGGLSLSIDDGLQQGSTSIVDNDTRRIDFVRLGALSGIDAGTRGTYYFDEFESSRGDTGPAPVVLTVSKTGTGSGTVTSNPAGINCGADCTESYTSGTSVILTAAAATGSTFTGWSGGGCSGTGMCTVNVTADTTVIANFNLQASNYTLTISKTGTGSGTVTSSPAGINCGADCSEAYASGTSVTLTASAASGSTFAGWSGGGCSGTGACNITITANTSVTANFNTTPPTDVIFEDGFESGSFSAWIANTNDSGDLSVSPAAALVGGQGMQAVVDDANAIFVRDDNPNAEPRYRARFYFDPNSIPMASGDAHFIFKGFSGTTSSYVELVRVELHRTSTGYEVRASLVNDGTLWANTAWVPIQDASNSIELDWRAATGASTNDGGLTLWVNVTEQQDVPGIDNDTRRIDFVRLGALTGIDTGTRGTYYFDAFVSSRQNYVGP